MAKLTESAEWVEDIYRLEITDDAIGGENGLANIQAKQLGGRTRHLKQAARQVAVQGESDAWTEGMAAVSGRLNALEGRGGPIQANDFGDAEPTQEELAEHACRQILGDGGEFTWDAETPSASTYEIGGLTHMVAEIFNATWVRNTFNDLNHRIVLTNTPDTNPAVFSWEDVGIDTVAVATPELPGVVRGGGDIEVDSITGEVTLVGQNAFSLSSLRNETLKEFTKRNGWHTVEIELLCTMTNRAAKPRKKVEVLTANYPIAVKLDPKSKKALVSEEED